MADVDCVPPPTVNLAPYIGIQLLAICTSMALWGVVCVQLFLYFFRSGVHDTRRMKGLVLWLWVMDAVHQCLLIAGGYNVTVNVDPVDVSIIQQEYVLIVLFTTLVSVPVQCFFAWKICLLLTNKVPRAIFALILIPAQLFRLVEGVIVFGYGIRHGDATQPTSGDGLALIRSNLIVGALVDVLISSGLVSLLWETYFEPERRNSRSAVASTNRTILFFANAGIWPGVFSVAALATVLGWPGNYIYISIYFVLSPLYLNMLLGTLNARSYLGIGADADLGKVLYLVSKPQNPSQRGMQSTMEYPQFQTRSELRSETETKVQVHVERSTTPAASVEAIPMQDFKQNRQF